MVFYTDIVTHPKNISCAWHNNCYQDASFQHEVHSSLHWITSLPSGIFFTATNIGPDARLPG
ncbi:MAG: hypothetical protein A2W76_06865 [Gammaproteobacteria bacterium RIFCSPLOWO2_12_47_11]|jgi:hypothetical protein|nr:MAG: hypothetical protein A2W76_06865 [Gammaproteobacteria bacterium RIFCSPLOWO2_12_47_11]